MKSSSEFHIDPLVRIERCHLGVSFMIMPLGVSAQ